jgi:hypothetical protein
MTTQLVEKLGEHLRGKETEKDIRAGITRGFLELNDMVRPADRAGPCMSNGLDRSPHAPPHTTYPAEQQMHQNPGIDDTLSGTTAITILFFGDTMCVPVGSSAVGEFAMRERLNGMKDEAVAPHCRSIDCSSINQCSRVCIHTYTHRHRPIQVHCQRGRLPCHFGTTHDRRGGTAAGGGGRERAVGQQQQQQKWGACELEGPGPVGRPDPLPKGALGGSARNR